MFSTAKRDLTILPEKHYFAVLVRKIDMTLLMGNIILAVFAEKHDFAVLAE